MFKKILIGGLILTVLVAVSAAVYQNTRAGVARAESNLGSITQAIGAANRNGNGSDRVVSQTEDTATTTDVEETITDSVASEQVTHTAISLASGDLSQEEAEALVYMVEEEKLARDVYHALYAIWGSSTFTNIAASEQTHIDSIKNLLAGYGIADPSSSQEGVFANSDLQALYDELVARGSQSMAEAFKVGAAVEEIDILDLQERLTLIDNPDIQQVFSNLLRGSGNHLRAFANALQAQTGEIYQPQYLTLEAYQAILSATAGNYGNGGGRGGNRGGNGYGGGQP